MIFSWASCSADVILRKVLLGSKTQLANQLKSSPCVPTGLLSPSAPPHFSAFWCVPIAKAKAQSRPPEVPLLSAKTGQPGEVEPPLLFN